jgi:hypothetical protein
MWEVARAHRRRKARMEKVRDIGSFYNRRRRFGTIHVASTIGFLGISNHKEQGHVRVLDSRK